MKSTFHFIKPPYAETTHLNYGIMGNIAQLHYSTTPIFQTLQKVAYWFITDISKYLLPPKFEPLSIIL